MRTFHGGYILGLAPGVRHGDSNRQLNISTNAAHKLLHAGLAYYCPMCDSLHVARDFSMATVEEFLEKGTY